MDSLHFHFTASIASIMLDDDGFVMMVMTFPVAVAVDDDMMTMPAATVITTVVPVVMAGVYADINSLGKCGRCDGKSRSGHDGEEELVHWPLLSIGAAALIGAALRQCTER